MSRLIPLVLLLLAVCALADEASSPLLLSGELRARESQVFYAPMTDDWQVEVQWLMPEGQVAQPGEIVVVFDGASIQGDIDSETVALNTAREKLQQEKNQHAQTVLEKEFALKREQLLLKKAGIDAAVPRQFLSDFEYESFQVAESEARANVEKARKELAQAKLARDVAIRKQQINIDRSLNKLELKRDSLAAMTLRAERAGPVLYGKHPWTGERVFVGMTAQPSWEIAEIPSMSDLYVEAWLHEIDIDRVRAGQSAMLTFDSRLHSTFPATLTDVSSQPQKRKEWGNGLYYRLVFSLAEAPEFKILPGMGARIEFPEADS
ncbi:HlyD family secretion protein [Microbulbifer guangxiensis]|uniref:HlyD family secretion protein n=1 Tax=Microbulbifer guangxiensis TaxID=2904249 RepID=UPI001F325469|nr:HlyD family efflux transporter periplasmic adaptor subunit [Microbulbifer guangxiensis]